jgi:hypothetical protein
LASVVTRDRPLVRFLRIYPGTTGAKPGILVRRRT